jgi:hypothetical protein
MPQVKVKTFSRLDPEWLGKPYGEQLMLVMQIDLLPRGSGNRNFARRLAASFKTHDLLGPQVVKVVAGTSRVTVHMRSTIAALEAVAECQRRVREQQAQADSSQLLLSL